MNKTKIGWCDYSWNPVTGCFHGCSYCYAYRLAQRFHDGDFDPKFHEDRLTEPLDVKKPSRIFVCSMGDLFGEWVPVEWIEDVLDVVNKAPHHTFFFLTKNPKRYTKIDFRDQPNIWLGTTCVDQDVYQSSSTYMRCMQIRKYKTFLSAEPIQSIIHLSSWWPDWVILGAQTGPGAPGTTIARYNSAVVTEYAQTAGIPVFHKRSLGDRFELRKTP